MAKSMFSADFANKLWTWTYYCISPSVYAVKEMDIRNVSRKEWSIAAVQTRRHCITLSCAWPTKVGEVIIII